MPTPRSGSPAPIVVGPILFRCQEKAEVVIDRYPKNNMNLDENLTEIIEVPLRESFTKKTSYHISRIKSSPTLIALTKLQQQAQATSSKRPPPSTSALTFLLPNVSHESPSSASASMRKSDSTPNLQTIMPKKRRVESPQRSLATTNPNDFLSLLLRSRNISPRTFSALELEEFFVEVTPDLVARYDMQIVSAVRAEDIETLRTIAKTKPLQCCNRFGESIVHTACRRGTAAVLRFLLQKDVNIRVACEQGRTPLHDTCWTAQTNFEIVEILLEVCPDFLYITDSRNLTPLSYISMKEQWGPWNHFLEEHQDLLLPKYLTFD